MNNELISALFLKLDGLEDFAVRRHWLDVAAKLIGYQQLSREDPSHMRMAEQLERELRRFVGLAPAAPFETQKMADLRLTYAEPVTATFFRLKKAVRGVGGIGRVVPREKLDLALAAIHR